MADNTLVPAFDVFKTYMSQYFANIDTEAPWLTSLYNASQKYYAMGLTLNPKI